MIVLSFRADVCKQAHWILHDSQRCIVAYKQGNAEAPLWSIPTKDSASSPLVLLLWPLIRVVWPLIEASQPVTAAVELISKASALLLLASEAGAAAGALARLYCRALAMRLAPSPAVAAVALFAFILCV